MAKKRKKILGVAVFLLFVLYFFGAARPIPLETVLVPRWLSSLESDNPVIPGESGQRADESEDSGVLFPFTLGSRFGYVDSGGRFSINQVKKGEIYIGENLWTEYDAEP
ncbi:MAG: WD40 repeat domain-containing protein, partial [Treponema sp.]|nr:WD40 repeat domain-containing protein [Treponema sp.]